MLVFDNGTVSIKVGSRAENGHKIRFSRALHREVEEGAEGGQVSRQAAGRHRDCDGKGRGEGTTGREASALSQ